MPVIIEISKNAILRDIQDKALERGRAEGEAIGEARGEARGEAKGKAEATRTLFHQLAKAKFGPTPKRLTSRISNASVAELELWAKNLLAAQQIDDIFKPTEEVR